MFKKGGYVIFKEHGKTGVLTHGKVYKVTSIKENMYIRVVNDLGIEGTYYITRFEPLPQFETKLGSLW